MTLVSSARAHGVTTLTLDSPHNRNALSTALIDELLAGLAQANADERARVVVLSHTGPVFCSGADLKESSPGAGRTPPAARLGEVIGAVWDSPKPVIARVGGPARAGVLGLVAAADIAVCADTATFAFSEVRIGVVPAVVSAPVRRRIAARAAVELMLTGEPFDGRRATAIGLVTACVPENELDDAVDRYVRALCLGGPHALAATKALLRRDFASGPISDELTELTALSVRYFHSPEGQEGIRAQREKRDPAWVAQQ